jgi:cytochrome d ubiquinol oxidase subunit II
MAIEAIWFCIWGFLWGMYFATDGFVLGIGALYLHIGKTDTDRRIILNSIGPVWDGNEVWLITAGAITFGAFPVVYAVMFTSLYTPLMLILFSLIIRGVSFEFRSKIASERWRGLWDVSIFTSSLLAAVLLGVAFANIFKGVLLDQGNIYQGTLLSLLNIYGLAGGALFLLMFVQHGLSWLLIKTEGTLLARCKSLAVKTWYALTAAVFLFLILTWIFTDLYGNYMKMPWLVIFPLLCVSGLTLNFVALKKNRAIQAWAGSAMTILGAACFGLGGLFPRLFPSSINDHFSLTIHNAAAEPGSLKIMLAVVCVFIPLVLFYQSYAYHLFSKPVTENDLQLDEAY